MSERQQATQDARPSGPSIRQRVFGAPIPSRSARSSAPDLFVALCIINALVRRRSPEGVSFSES
jgi:hypothetical protein